MFAKTLNRLSFALAFLLTFLFIVAELAQGAAAPRVPQQLMQKAQRDGSVRVIVQLAVSDVGATLSDSDILSKMRRTRIAQAHDSVRGGLLGVAHQVHHQFEDFPFIVLELGRDGLQTLDSMQGLVTQVFEDKLERPLLAESIPIVQANQVWAGGFGGVPYDGSGVVVAILDSGVDKNHPFLQNVVEEACYSSNNAADGATSVCPGGVTSSTAVGSGMPCGLSSCNHGTHVAGIATGNGNGGTVAAFSGVAKGADVMAVQVFSRFDSASACAPSASPCILAYTSDIMAGLQRVYDLRGVYNFASINLSLGGGGSTTVCDTDPRKPIIDLLRAANIATVIASGNNGFTNQISFPGCISSAVSVGSTGDGSGGFTQDAVSSFSNSASFLSLLAPGELITSSVPGTGFANFRGTSMATPHVAGAFALIKQALPGITVSQALSALQTGGLPVLDTRNGITKPRIRILNALATFDTTPPDTIITGSPLAVTNLTTATFTFNSTKSGGTFACKLDAGAFAACTSPKSYPGLTAGSHTFQVRATDMSNNTDPTPATSNWTIDLTPPDTSITSAPSGTIAVNSAAFTWTGSDNVTAVGSLQYAYRLDPLEPSFSAFGSATTKSYASLANGSYTFIVKARDQASNEDISPATQAFTVNVAPVTRTLTVASSNPTSGAAVTVSPNDNNGQGNGSTLFTRVYNNNTAVTLVAAATAAGNNFSSWTGCDSVTGTTCNVTLSADKTVTAVYVAPTGTWTFCANENQFCSFSGTKLVRYGAGTTFTTKTATNGISCANWVFGDPIPGVAKHCDYSNP